MKLQGNVERDTEHNGSTLCAYLLSKWNISNIKGTTQGIRLKLSRYTEGMLKSDWKVNIPLLAHLRYHSPQN